ncbi:NRDE family protein [uncultured Castellaniella sp.]|uniref:NRDE family protein n=1 Tax=uncultured Castellaniella sp. TaxID=647907 RepID=UPI0026223D8A|nr:NRDE family protein [uncultured Castellaniella sp.]
MCIAYLSLGRPDWPVLIAANRDEFHARPARAAGPWPGRPDVIAGQDLGAGGAWLGWAAGGRFALLTNYREPGLPTPPGAPSRGVLVRDYLLGSASAADYSQAIADRAGDWAGFNLIAGDAQEAWYLGNRDPSGSPRRLSPGCYVLSNHLLDTPWPKSRRLREALDALPPERWAREPDRVFELLHDTTPAPAGDLPATGLSPDREQLLSSPFIVSPDYGTRCSSLIVLRADGAALFSEQSYDASGQPAERHDWRSRAWSASPRCA